MSSLQMMWLVRIKMCYVIAHNFFCKSFLECLINCMPTRSGLAQHPSIPDHVMSNRSMCCKLFCKVFYTCKLHNGTLTISIHNYLKGLHRKHEDRLYQRIHKVASQKLTHSSVLPKEEAWSFGEELFQDLWLLGSNLGGQVVRPPLENFRNLEWLSNAPVTSATLNF